MMQSIKETSCALLPQPSAQRSFHILNKISCEQRDLNVLRLLNRQLIAKVQVRLTRKKVWISISLWL